MPDQEHGESVALPELAPDPLLGFIAEGIRLERLIHATASSRTYYGRREDGQELEVWIAADHLAGDAAFLVRLQTESQLLSSLRHVHVESYLGQRQWSAPGGRTLVVSLSESSPGILLGELRRTDRLPVRDVLRLFHQACAGLAVAHRMGIVHGDITPDTIRVTAGGAARLRAFALGVSGFTSERAEHALVGSPDFMAPEVGRGQQPSSLSDLYSVGASMMTVLTGDLPFAATTALEAIHRNGTAPLPDLACTHPEFAAVAPLITRLMAKDPSQRWMATEDLARDLLLLAGEVAADLRCRTWNNHRPESLATRVQTALLQRPGHQSSPVPTSPPNSATNAGSPKESSTSISRKSVEYFRNPELFKPTGISPVGGLPALSSAPNQPATTRTIRRLEATAPMSGGGASTTPADVVNTVATVPTIGDRAPAKTSSYLSSLAASSGAAVVPATTATTAPAAEVLPRRRWLLAATALVMVVAVIAVVVLRPRPTVITPITELPRSGPVVAPPARDGLDAEIAAVVALARHDPAAALSRAAMLRREHPQADLASLPRALRLEILGPVASAVHVSTGGEPLAMTADGTVCLLGDGAFVLEISAAGFRTRAVEIPASSADTTAQTIALFDQPRWSLPPIAPTWVRLLPAADGVVVACDLKVALHSWDNGTEIARLDQAKAQNLLPEKPTWSAVLGVDADRLRLGLSGGLCLETDLEGFANVRELHRGQASVFALSQAPLVLRLGESGTFSVQRDNGVLVLVADSHERRLWSRPLSGSTAPWFTVQGDHLVVAEARAVRHLSQEGEELAEVSLPAMRTGEPVVMTDGSLLIPTSDGVLRLVGRSAPVHLPGSHGQVLACVTAGSLVAAAVGREVLVWQNGAEGLQLLWRQEPVSGERQVHFLRLQDEQLIIVDDGGEIRWLAQADGRVLRTVRPGARSLAAPVLRGQQIVVALDSGVLSAF